MKSRLSPLTPDFEFASFAWPRYLAILPCAPLKSPARMERYTKPVTGECYHAPIPLEKRFDKGRGFYLGAFFDLRWQWADKVDGARIRHKGWYGDEYGDTVIRGIVVRLPKGRGFLAGWSMGKGMSSAIDPDIYVDEASAAHAADSLAERTAEAEREYQEKDRAEQAKLEASEEYEGVRDSLYDLLHDLRTCVAGPHACHALRDKVRSMRAEMHKLYKAAHA